MDKDEQYGITVELDSNCSVKLFEAIDFYEDLKLVGCKFYRRDVDEAIKVFTKFLDLAIKVKDETEEKTDE